MNQGADIMRTISKIAIPALALLSTIGTFGTVAASAQPLPPRDSRHGTPARADAIRSQIAELEQRVNRNDNRDRISEREAAGLRREVQDIRNQFRTFSRDGLNDNEFRTLQTRIDRAKARLHVERHDDNGRPGDRRR
jgi:septal ring factor EnvC (AmiA/AmiB activator)